jgi:hypothetical protein
MNSTVRFEVSRRDSQPLRALLPALASLALAGCGLSQVCSDVDQPYRQARDLPPLKAPAGMNAPNRAGGLDIPPPPAPDAPAAAVRTRAAGQCLDAAPSYFGTALSPLSSPEEVVAMWAQAWSERNTERMMSAYSQRFEAPADTASAAWLEQRREQAATGPVPEAGVQGLRVTTPEAERRVITFAQRFETNTIRRELTLIRENGFWRIIAERVIDLE